MATIIQRRDKWRVQIRLRGIVKSRTFIRHQDAKAWAAREESIIMDGLHGNASRNHTFGDVAQRYLNEITPTKRGSREETYRIKRALRTFIADIELDKLSPNHFAEWRDMRLQEVSPDSVKRELGTMSAICDHALKEWSLLNDNPVHKIRKPKGAPARTRRPSDLEIEQICSALNWPLEDNPYTKPDLDVQRVALSFLFAIETAMRASEICDLTWQYVDLKRRVVHLPKSKNGHARDVPLSKRALEIIQLVKGINDVSVFDVPTESRDTLFRRARDKCGISDLHFHDSRREALTRMSKKVPVEVLAKISGHRDLRILLNVYYRPDMADIASMLD